VRAWGGRRGVSAHSLSLMDVGKDNLILTSGTMAFVFVMSRVVLQAALLACCAHNFVGWICFEGRCNLGKYTRRCTLQAALATTKP